MTDFYADLYTFLQSFPAITTLVSTRVYPVKLPQTPKMPAIVTLDVTTVPRYTQDGPAVARSPVYQLTCFAESVKDANALATVVETAISGYSGTLGTRSVGGIFILTVRDGYDPETGLNSKSIDTRFLVR